MCVCVIYIYVYVYARPQKTWHWKCPYLLDNYHIIKIAKSHCQVQLKLPKNTLVGAYYFPIFSHVPFLGFPGMASFRRRSLFSSCAAFLSSLWSALRSAFSVSEGGSGGLVGFALAPHPMTNLAWWEAQVRNQNWECIPQAATFR